ncbi:MAG TPA: glycosyltransferase family 4 protein [Caulobacteraceae bacterium]
MTRLKIAIATAGRFHVLDLARELHALGHEVRFYSYVPRARARRFGLPDRCHVGLLAFTWPFLVWDRLAPRLWPQTRERFLHQMLDRAVIFRLRPCDVFICMSGIYLAAARHARQRFGARVWLERGSMHILAQDEILAAIPGATRPDPYVVRRELEGHRLADRIVVPSRHVVDSFVRDPAAWEKLFRNPYGVDLAMFPQQKHRPSGAPLELLFVGAWSLQKGCDVLTTAVRTVDGVRLTHVGPMGDLAFPVDDHRFSHFAPVTQPSLTDFYSKSDVLVLPSRQDGFGLVLPQALASGLPVICTDRTGGIDLAHTPALAERITLVPVDDASALAEAIARRRDRAREGFSCPPLAETDRQTLSWTAYAWRYSDELVRDVAIR